MSDINKRVLKTTTFKVERTILEQFRTVCKEHGIVQSKVVERAMIQLINDMKKENTNDN